MIIINAFISNADLILLVLFSGGAIPTYIIYTKWYHLLNSFWVYILPGLSGGAWGILCFRAFFKSVPESLFESARLDGASELLCYFRIAIPLSMPVIAVIALYYASGHWNGYFNAMIYLNDQAKYPLQLFLKEILVSSRMVNADIDDPSELAEMQRLASTIKYGVIIVGSLPMLLLYPFIQRYFVKGVMIGTVKG